MSESRSSDNFLDFKYSGGIRSNFSHSVTKYEKYKKNMAKTIAKLDGGSQEDYRYDLMPEEALIEATDIASKSLKLGTPDKVLKSLQNDLDDIRGRSRTKDVMRKLRTDTIQEEASRKSSSDKKKAILSARSSKSRESRRDKKDKGKKKDKSDKKDKKEKKDKKKSKSRSKSKDKSKEKSKSKSRSKSKDKSRGLKSPKSSKSPRESILNKLADKVPDSKPVVKPEHKPAVKPDSKPADSKPKEDLLVKSFKSKASKGSKKTEGDDDDEYEYYYEEVEDEDYKEDFE